MRSSPADRMRSCASRHVRPPSSLASKRRKHRHGGRVQVSRDENPIVRRLRRRTVPGNRAGILFRAGQPGELNVLIGALERQQHRLAAVFQHGRRRRRSARLAAASCANAIPQRSASAESRMPTAGVPQNAAAGSLLPEILEQRRAQIPLGGVGKNHHQRLTGKFAALWRAGPRRPRRRRSKSRRGCPLPSPAAAPSRSTPRW